MKLIGRLAVIAALVVMASPAVHADHSVTVLSNAALGGTSYGLSVNIDPAASNLVAYVESDHPVDETHMLVRFRLNLRDITGAPLGGPGAHFRFMNWIDDAQTSTPHKILFAQRQPNGNWRLAVWTRNTTANTYEFVGGLFLQANGADADNQIECEWQKATSGANGQFGCDVIAGPSIGQTLQRNTIDDGAIGTDKIRAGIFDFDSFAGGGDFHFDEYESYR